MQKTEPSKIGGKTVEEWDRQWVPVAGGLKHHQPKLNDTVGLYRVSFKGQIMALGTGTDKSGGLAKRLSDFHRPSASGRTHYAGERINDELDQLEVEVLVTGKGMHAREVGRQLKTPMIRLHKPLWTAPNPPHRPKKQ